VGRARVGFGARTEPLLLGISTAGYDRASFLGDLVREGEEGKDRRFLYRWIGLPADSEADCRDPKTWREPVAGRVFRSTRSIRGPLATRRSASLLLRAIRPRSGSC